jgi:hypothetical protein
VPSEPGTEARIADIAKSLRVPTAGVPRALASGNLVRPPRIGLYHGWGGNMDEGWTRWVLEQFEFPYTSVFDRDVRAGNLRAKFDVILLPDATYEQMLNGLPVGSMPDAYTGGMTAAGISHLYQFTAAGGTLVAMARAAELPLSAFGLAVQNVTAGAPDTDFYVPGSILRISVDPNQPIAYGMPPEAAAFVNNSPAFAVARRRGGASAVEPAAQPAPPDNIRVVARYPASNLLLSGWMVGERMLAGRAAVVDVSIDKGRVVLLGFQAEHRGQSHGTYKLLFNSILLATSGPPSRSSPPR